MRVIIKLDEKEKVVEITGFPKGTERLGTDGPMKLIPGKEREVTADEFNHINNIWRQRLRNIKIHIVQIKA